MLPNRQPRERRKLLMASPPGRSLSRQMNRMRVLYQDMLPIPPNHVSSDGTPPGDDTV
jgi:hypothetical protein